MERTALSLSAVNIITVNLMVFIMAFLLLLIARVMRGRRDA